jgi:hypothetical protein
MVMHMDTSRREPTKPITVRIPKSDYQILRDYSEKSNVSLNMLVADAVTEQIAKIERQAVLSDIAEFHKRLGKKTPPTAVDDLYEIRRGRTAQLTSDKPREEPRE